MMIFKAMLIFAALGTAAPSYAVASPAPAEQAIDVVGWPLPDLTGDAPKLSVGDDPVYGRQVCPPLTRLNLDQKRSEDLLLKKVAEEFRDPTSGAAWRFEVRSGLFWWSGAPVTAEDVANFVRASLPSVVKARGGGIWTVPDVKVDVDGAQGVLVRWQKTPAFGPYVLNDAPFYRPVSGGENGIGYECAGLYRPQADSLGMTLVPTPGYRFKHPLPPVRLYKDGVAAPASARRLELRYASSLSGSPAERAPDAGSGCGRTLDLPYATMIVWNPRKAPTGDKAFRHIMTQLVPRGTLANAGAGSLGDVDSAPVPRQHPGFNPKIATRPFDMKAAADGLNRLGYKRKTADSPRLTPDGQPLKLTLVSLMPAPPENAGSHGSEPPPGPGLVEKVIMDAYSAVGITVEFKNGASSTDDADGVLAAFALDWPRVSFLGNLHSAAAAPAPFWPLKDPDLDHLLETYAASLTMEKPNFGLLAAVHKRIAELEPVTVLLTHKACLETGAGLRLAKGPLTQKDPDWFRQLLF
jgi:ABC-type transport system substrate-binding protein